MRRTLTLATAKEASDIRMNCKISFYYGTQKLIGFICPAAYGSFWPRGASTHFKVDVFVFAMSSVSVLRLRLLMILLANESGIKRQLQIAVHLVRIRDSAPISEAMAVLQEYQDSDTRYGFIYISRRLCFERVLTEVFAASLAMIVCCGRSCSHMVGVPPAFLLLKYRADHRSAKCVVIGRSDLSNLPLLLQSSIPEI
jgi:hypothetical protein